MRCPECKRLLKADGADGAGCRHCVPWFVMVLWTLLIALMLALGAGSGR